MQRSRFSTLAVLVLVLAAVACSENPNEIKLLGRTSAVVAPTGTLDQNIVDVLKLFPKGLETAATTRWANVKQKYAAGLSDPAQMTVAKQMLFELSAWVQQKTPNMDNPPAGEAKGAASARAVLYMSMYVYGGPSTPTPPYLPAADATVGIVTPTTAATIVTPTTHAGVKLDAGSVAENTVIVVTQNPTPYPENCSGPLRTKFCQYPQFYTFEMFPHAPLLKAATFNVCHVNTGKNRYPLADHERFSLAHTKPADPANYVLGGKVFDGNGESIEILPRVYQDFSHCELGDSYASNNTVGGPLGALSRFARGLQKMLTPKTAYAIDVGLGGLSLDMSPFNVLDTLSSPDIAVQSVSVSQASVHPGDHVALSYSVTNIGTATLAPAHASIVLTPVPIEGAAPPGQQIAAFEIDSIVPLTPRTGNNLDVAIPSDVSAGAYTLALVIDDDPNFPDANLANNTGISSIVVGGEVWRVIESGNWNGTWIRRGSSDVFDAVWTGPQNGFVTAVMTYTRNGSDVDFQRTVSSDGRLCHYIGTILPDGLTATGSETCPDVTGAFTWTASIGFQ